MNSRVVDDADQKQEFFEFQTRTSWMVLFK